jgi:uncharacterized protein
LVTVGSALAQETGTGQANPAPAPNPAANPAPPPALSATHRQAAEALIQAMNMEATFKESMETMLKMQIEANPALAQFEDIMREFMNKYLSWTDLRSDFVGVYANLFTESELRGLNTFYETPLGKKLLTTMPELMARSSQVSQQKLQEHLPELQQKIMARVQQQQQQPHHEGDGHDHGQPGQQPGQPGQPQQQQGQPQQPEQGQPQQPDQPQAPPPPQP